MSRKGSVYRKKGKINEPFVAMRHSMLKGPLVNKGYLKPVDIFFYAMIRAKETGDPDLDRRLIFTNEEAKKYASITTFSLAKFRLWAYRCLEVTQWGRKCKTASTFKHTLKWKTLSYFPKKLERINTLVKRHERVMNFRAKNKPKRSKEERLQKKRQLYVMIRKKIMGVPL